MTAYILILESSVSIGYLRTRVCMCVCVCVKGAKNNHKNLEYTVENG